MEYFIGVDIGTTSTKAVAFDLKGKVIADNQIEYPIQSPAPSFFEQDPEEIFEAVIKSIAFVTVSISSKTSFTYKLAGISFSSAMHSLIAVDASGKPLTPCIIWADTRSKAYAERIKRSKEGHEIYMNTGTPVHPMSPLCKLAWMKDNLKEVFGLAHKFISIKEYVFFKFFGRYVIDHSIASATGLFNIHHQSWHTPSLELVGVSEEQLSKPVPITHIEYGVKAEFAQAMQVVEDTPFIIGGSDGCMANLGSNAVNPGEAAVTIGTSGAIRVISDKPQSDEDERIFSYILTEDKFVLGGPVNNGGVVLRWFRDNFAALEVQEALAKNIDPYDLIIQNALLVPPGAEGLIFLPYLYGERAPHWDADAKGVFFGLQAHHTRAHFARAVLEGITFGLYNVGQALEEITGKIKIIYANGGFVRSPGWVQMLADVFNIQVHVTESFESSSFGAALTGMKALGLYTSFDKMKHLIPVAETYIPDTINHEMYKKNFVVFKRLYEKLKDEFTGQ